MTRKSVFEMTIQELRDEVLILRDLVDRPAIGGEGFAGLPERWQGTARPPEWRYAFPTITCGGGPRIQ